MAKFGKQPIIILVIIIILGIIIMITWDDEDVSILVSVVGTMPGCAVADGEPGSLVADQLQRYLVFGIQYLVFVKRGRRPKRKHGSKIGGSGTTIMSIRVVCFSQYQTCTLMTTQGYAVASVWTFIS